MGAHDPLHTNPQNRVHRDDESRWERRDEGERSSTPAPNPFKSQRDGAPLRRCLQEVSYTQETRSKDAQFSTQKTTFHKHVQMDACLFMHVSFFSITYFFHQLSQRKQQKDQISYTHFLDFHDAEVGKKNRETMQKRSLLYIQIHNNNK